MEHQYKPYKVQDIMVESFCDKAANSFASYKNTGQLEKLQQALNFYDEAASYAQGPDKAHCYRKYASAILYSKNRELIAQHARELNTKLTFAFELLAESLNNEYTENKLVELQRLLVQHAKLAMDLRNGPLLEKLFSLFQLTDEELANPAFKLDFYRYAYQLYFAKGAHDRAYYYLREAQAISDDSSIETRQACKLKLLECSKIRDLQERKQSLSAWFEQYFWPMYDHHKLMVQKDPDNPCVQRELLKDCLYLFESKLLVKPSDSALKYIVNEAQHNGLRDSYSQELFHKCKKAIKEVSLHGKRTLTHQYFPDIEPPSFKPY